MLIDVANESGPTPRIRIVALVPIDTIICKLLEPALMDGTVTYKDLRPAIRGWVAQDPPRTILCLPSKKSAVERQVTLATRGRGLSSEYTNLYMQGTTT